MACCQLPIAQQFQHWASGIASLVAAGVAVGAYVKYRDSKRLERSKWVLQLYEKFYEQGRLRRIRQDLDCETSTTETIEKLVDDEDEDFIDYLNFFEFVSYLRESEQVSDDDVEALFGYYLDCLVDRDRVRKYVFEEDKKNRSFEYLGRTLRARQTLREKQNAHIEQ
jgi:hypothetical protein